MCRALLHFLGIKYDNGLKSEAPPKRTDVSLQQFGLPLLTVQQATNGSDQVITEALELVLKTANKGVGHLTIKPARELMNDLKPLRVACDRTLQLVNKHLYKMLPEPLKTECPSPKFERGGYGWVEVEN